MLAPDYVADLPARTTDEIRAMRDAAEEEESGVSYARRILQGKLDILRAEALRRRDEGEAVTSVLEALPDILADEPRPTGGPLPVRAPRHLIPPTVRHHRREVDAIVDEDVLADLTARSIDELAALVAELAERERRLSATRRTLLDRIDRLQEEMTRRYKAGTANVGEVLARGR